MRKKIELYALAVLVMLLPSLLAYTCGKDDADGDGYDTSVDCDDSDPNTYPGATEPCACDGIDQNCNGVVDDFPCDLACFEDADGDGYDTSVDCDDTDPAVHPDQEEPCICDDIDQNCNGSLDDYPCDFLCLHDQDGDGYDSSVDCDDTDPTVHPDQEEPCACDNIDQNCNGVVDDFPCDMACPVDVDGDGYPADKDCNDYDPNTYPGATEPCVCDAIDQNCNGVYDDNPCMGPKACEYQSEGEVCAADQGQYCAPGLVCCYPCGVQGCQFQCMKPCDASEPWCSGGCPLYP